MLIGKFHLGLGSLRVWAPELQYSQPPAFVGALCLCNIGRKIHVYNDRRNCMVSKEYSVDNLIYINYNNASFLTIAA